jgi:acid stress chaperone HdeA
MKVISAAVGIAVCCIAFSAQAAEVKKPLAEWTCADFVGLDAQFQPKAVYWAAAYAKSGKPEAAVLDVEGIEKLTPAVVADCKQDPKASYWTTLKADWQKLDAAAKADAKKVEKKL